MVHILIGHLSGMAVAFFLKEKISKGGNVNNPKILIAMVVIGLLSFFEYQLYNSLNKGHLYWRGKIYYSESPGRFRILQYCYSILAGYFIFSGGLQLFF